LDPPRTLFVQTIFKNLSAVKFDRLLVGYMHARRARGRCVTVAERTAWTAWLKATAATATVWFDHPGIFSKNDASIPAVPAVRMASALRGPDRPLDAVHLAIQIKFRRNLCLACSRKLRKANRELNFLGYKNGAGIDPGPDCFDSVPPNGST
jgi:hypothetical protein